MATITFITPFDRVILRGLPVDQAAVCDIGADLGTLLRRET